MAGPGKRGARKTSNIKGYLFKMPSKMHARLKVESKKAGLRMADLMRLALRNLFKELDQDK